VELHSETLALADPQGSHFKDGDEHSSDMDKPITLDSAVTARGSNFSHGQRQLIALARALLRRTSIIMMDEATSRSAVNDGYVCAVCSPLTYFCLACSIDFETDVKIQRTLKEEFGGSCVITIAHRLQTIIDYDRVVSISIFRSNSVPSFPLHVSQASRSHSRRGTDICISDCYGQWYDCSKWVTERSYQRKEGNFLLSVHKCRPHMLAVESRINFTISE
jgi:hypothetical protein